MKQNMQALRALMESGIASPARLAREAGVSRATMRRIRDGADPSDIKIQARLGAAFDFSRKGFGR